MTQVSSLGRGALGLMSVLLIGAACGSSGGAPPSPTSRSATRDCRSLTFPYPPADASLKAEDNGKSVDVPIGGLVSVALVGGGKHWSSITAAGTSLLRLSTQAATATVGTQLAEYCAVSKGSVKLASNNETSNWTATVDVR
jgi:hypothetical protein